MTIKQRLAMIVGGVQQTREIYTTAALHLNADEPEVAEKAVILLRESERIFAEWQGIIDKEVEELLELSGSLPDISTEPGGEPCAS